MSLLKLISIRAISNREINAALINTVMSDMPNCDEVELSEVNELNHGASAVSSTVVSAVGTGQLSTLKSVEEKHIRALLDRYKGNRKRVAAALGISERTIYRKLKDLGIT